MEERNSQGLASYLAVLRAHWLAASLVFILTIAGAVAYLETRGQKYEATAEVLVTPVPSDQAGVLGLPLITEAADATRVSQTAAALLRNNRAAAAVVPSLPSGWDRDRVLRSIVIKPRGESNVIAITATADHPGVAARLANRYTAASLRVRNSDLRGMIPSRIAGLRSQLAANAPGVQRGELAQRITSLSAIQESGDPSLALSQGATVPDTSSSPSAVVIGVAAAVVGLALAFAIAVALSSTDKRITDEDELLGMSPLPVLARIADSNRSAARAQAAEAYRTLWAQLNMATPRPEAVLITSGSSGDGKTSSTLALARAARETGQRVIVLLFDARRPYDVGGDRKRRSPLNRIPVDAQDERRLWANSSLADCLLRCVDDRELAFALPGLGGPEERAAVMREMPRFVNEARARADLVIVDSAPLGEVGDALVLLEAVDAMVLLARLGETARPAYEMMLDLTARSGRRRFGVVIIGAADEGSSSYYRREMLATAPGA